MNMTLSEIAACVQGVLVGDDVTVSSVSIDTRTIKSGQLYVAIKGPNFDGNEFVSEAEQAGAIAAIVHPGITSTVPHIVVDDTHLALAELAGAWRKKASVSVGHIGSIPIATLLTSMDGGNAVDCREQSRPPSLAVVGITGSNGKTTVKEMVAAILSVNGNTLFTQGNLNNDIGVPLTLLRLNEQHRYAVIEMGANHPGEIAYTSQYVQADVAIITNVGAAHIEGFGSVDGVAEAKGEIIRTLKQDGTAVLNRDDAYFDYWKSVAGNRKIISFGLDAQASVPHLRPVGKVTAHSVKTEIINHEFATTFELVTSEGELTVKLKLAGRHNVINALAATAACLALDIDLQQIKQGLESVKPVTGRLQPLLSRLGNIVIDDTYNANSASLKAGLDVLANCPGKPWLVLGAFGELGPESPKIHEQMGELIKSSGVVRLLAVGSDAQNTAKVFGKAATFFDSQNDLIEVLKQELKGDEAILIKGSRAQRMEKVAAALVENFRI
ncbi:MAG: UDP-N-acetylmuramoyl-tripeptide--D-alanyl-D-alanine ligase [Methylococcaceae bacterium]